MTALTDAALRLTCGDCGEDKPDEAFARCAALPRRRCHQYMCRECSNARALANYHAKRGYYADKARRRNAEMRAWMNELKSAPCTDCGWTFPPYVMDWDHVHGDKGQDLSKMMRRRMARSKIAAELAKCELVCANCHRMRTHDRLVAAGLPDPAEVQ